MIAYDVTTVAVIAVLVGGCLLFAGLLVTFAVLEWLADWRDERDGVTPDRAFTDFRDDLSRTHPPAP